MFKHTIEYVDYNGHQRKEDFYFNLNKAEIVEMEMSINGGLTETIKQLVVEEDQEKIVKIFKELILKSYGRKSVDGKYFEKSEEISRQFMHTEAFSNLYVKMMQDSTFAAEFFNKVIEDVGVAPDDKVIQLPTGV